MFEFPAWETEEPASSTRPYLKDVEENHIYGRLKITAYSSVLVHSAPPVSSTENMVSS
jgi:hypothetical protein